MFQDSTGLDVIRAQHLDLSGRPANHADMIEGRRFVVESFYLMALLRRASGGVSKRGMRQHAPHGASEGARELAWWCRDDPLPFLTMSLRLFARVLGRALRRCSLSIWGSASGKPNS
jgi:hypothetical protein